MIGYQRLPELEFDSAPVKSSDDRDLKRARSPEEGLSSTDRSKADYLQTTNVPTTENCGEAQRDDSQSVIAPIVKDQQSRYEDLKLPRNAEWIRRASIEHHQRCHLRIDIPQAERCPPTDDEAFTKYSEDYPLVNDGMPCESISHYSLLAMMTGTPLRPFGDLPKIVPLSKVTGRNKSRNRDVDVLAVVESVDSKLSKPPKMQMKRDIRIMDPSVAEPVTVSIFVDPVNFRANVGLVALFRHVTTHDWKNGRLNAYPARVGGREWFIPQPQCLGLRDEMGHVETWWLAMQGQGSMEAIKSHGIDA